MAEVDIPRHIHGLAARGAAVDRRLRAAERDLWECRGPIDERQDLSGTGDAADAVESSPAFHKDLTLNQNSYPLLGANRGLSEGFICFVPVAHGIDWARLREGRF